MFCPTCFKYFDQALDHCPEDGTKLLVQPSPSAVGRQAPHQDSYPSPVEKNEESAELKLGDTVGDYVIEGLLGRGGMATVYQAKHVELGRNVAIKVLKRAFTFEPRLVKRFRQEAKLANAVKHPGIVQIEQISQLPDGSYYHVMELLEGKTLGGLFKQGNVDQQMLLTVIKGLRGILSEAHAAGIVHRDIKPSNIFIVSPLMAITEQSVRLLDFGIAKLFDRGNSGKELTRTGQSIGTPAYSSPEQCCSHPVDHRSDIYSVGVICYRMLTGQLPYVGNNSADILRQQLHGPPTPPSELNPSLGGAVDRFIRIAMAQLPDGRFQNIGALADALEQAFAADSVAAGHPVSTKGYRQKLTLISAGLLLCMGAGGIYWLTSRHETVSSSQVLSNTPAQPSNIAQDVAPRVVDLSSSIPDPGIPDGGSNSEVETTVSKAVKDLGSRSPRSRRARKRVKSAAVRKKKRKPSRSTRETNSQRRKIIKDMPIHF